MELEELRRIFKEIIAICDAGRDPILSLIAIKRSVSSELRRIDKTRPANDRRL
jgi:hypothetical protein